MGVFKLSFFFLIFLRFRRATHVTPKSYLNFISGYKNIYQIKQQELGEGAQRMETGLRKLDEASRSVEILKKDLAVMEQELAQASQKAERVRKCAYCKILSFKKRARLRKSSKVYFYFTWSSVFNINITDVYEIISEAKAFLKIICKVYKKFVLYSQTLSLILGAN